MLQPSCQLKPQELIGTYNIVSRLLYWTQLIRRYYHNTYKLKPIDRAKNEK